MMNNIFTDCCLTKLICVHQAHKKLIFFLCENGGKTATFITPSPIFYNFVPNTVKTFLLCKFMHKTIFFNIIDDLCSSGASCAFVDLRSGEIF